MRIDLHYKHIGRMGWLVINEHTQRHTHLCKAKESTVKGFMRNLRSGILPKSKFLQDCAKKILTDREYQALRPVGEKQRYYNVNRGVR